MKADIALSVESLERRILELEQSPSPAKIQETLDALGLSHLKTTSAQVVTLMDMFSDGITPVNTEIVSALLGICEAHKKFFYALAGFLEHDAGAVTTKTPDEAGAAADTEAVPTAMAAFDETGEASAPNTRDAASAAPAPPPQESDPAATDLPQKPGGNGKGGVRQAAISSIRVGTDRLDKLIELVGKLMVTHAVITSQASSGQVGKTATNMTELDSVIGQLQSEVDAIRLVPLKQIFMPMHRLVQSLSQKIGKKVQFSVVGDELALDKSLVESLNEPLVHLLRNALDHGLETPEERTNAGKPETGQVRLEAFRKGETAYIQVDDDGRGLDPDRILAKAMEKGLADPDKEYSEAEILHFILQSGFSTAAQVTDISGRGVGMDAVVNAIRNSLDGDVRIDNRQGNGATFTISVPLSRSANEGIVEALVCRIGDQTFLIPSRDVVEIYAPVERDIVQLPDGRETIDVRGAVHSLLRLARHLGVSSAVEDVSRAQAVVVRVGDWRAGILVDEVTRQQQVVITNFTVPVQDIYGVPIIGFGMMGESDALVINTEQLLQNYTVASE